MGLLYSLVYAMSSNYIDTKSVVIQPNLLTFGLTNPILKLLIVMVCLGLISSYIILILWSIIVLVFEYPPHRTVISLTGLSVLLVILKSAIMNKSSSINHSGTLVVTN